MKCQYCGSNLDAQIEVCPFCGRENAQVKKYVDTIKEYKKEYDETEKKVQKKVKLNARTGRLIFIALMVVIIAVMYALSIRSDDASARIDRSEEKIKQTVDKNIGSIEATLEEMERNREYMAMEYYTLNYRLRSHEAFKEYDRVFTAVISYNAVLEDIINIADGYDYFGEKDEKDWCNEIANFVATWNRYVDGEFWGDTPDSPMHAGEHGAFLSDIKIAVRDIVQVYFRLSDEQADTMWTMDAEELSSLLYNQYMSIYPEVSENE